jgi:hypothetical protein
MAPTAQHGLEKLRVVVADLERKRNSRVYVIIHSQDPQHICGPTLQSLLNKRQGFPEGDTLDILLHSPGGHADIAYQAIKFFRRRYKSVNAIVPLMAKSAATLMCLGMDNIYMGEFAELGPIDVQIDDPVEKGSTPVSPINDFKSMEFLREYAVDILDYFVLALIERSGMSVKEAIHESLPAVTGIIRPLYEKIDPLEVGGHRRELAIGEEYAKRILQLVRNPNCDSIVEQLVWKYPSHDFVLDCEECKRLGLPVELLDRATDISLVQAIQEFIRTGIPYHGFLTDKPTISAPKAAPKARSGRKVPTRANGRVSAES